ncbi:MAG TPA: RNA polymerase subunit sigma-70 [Thermoanaerobaculia bacterium]|nr:RNA polymerase subunit sigma-70 [Thermoanaerobaculia bacterium]
MDLLPPTRGSSSPPAADDFEALVAAHRRELQVHCYRMLGCWTEAEDLLQEALVRAWRGLARFEGRSSVRTWLYQIATNACLTALARRERRGLPETLRPAAAEGGALEPPEEGVAWLQPLPTPSDLDVEAQAESRQALTLAFAVALQHLPPRQRATLLLRDVVGCEAREVAEMIGTSTPAVNSALVRARERMERFRAEHGDEPPVAPLDSEQQRRIDSYLAAWEAADVPALAALLSDEAVFSMPPYPTWYRGRAAVARALEEIVFAQGRAFRLLRTAANGRPAFAVYRRGAAGPGLAGARDTARSYTGTGIQVLVPRPTGAGGGIERVVTFLDARLVPRFGLPPALAPEP